MPNGSKIAPMSFMKEFKEFAVRGNMVDLAVGIIIGAAFTGIVNSLVNDIIMPPIGLLTGNVDFTDLFVVLKEGAQPGPYLNVEAAKAAGAVTLNYGLFVNQLVSFLIVAFTVFLLVKGINRMRREEPQPAGQAPAPVMKECPFCKMTIPGEATRCPQCTSELA